MLPGLTELAESYIQLPAISPNLRNLKGLTDIAKTPVVANAAGLALYGLRYPRETIWGQPPNWSLGGVFKVLFSWLGGDR